MRVLLAHVGYRVRGGEESVFESDAELLERAGYEVSRRFLGPEHFDSLPASSRAVIGATFSNHAHGRGLMRSWLAEDAPDIVHVHNIYPSLGPGALAEALSQGVPVVRTVHNYRFSCVAGTHHHRGSLCERCSAGHGASGVVRGCYRDSRAQSLLMDRALDAERALYLSNRSRTRLIAPTRFLSDRLVQCGFPRDMIKVRANFARKVARPVAPSARSGCLFVGRLSEEKGIADLLRAWPAENPLLTVAGDGPCADEVKAAAGENVRLLGRVDASRTRELMAQARLLVLPSVWFEVLPMVLCEAYAEDLPAICFSGTSMEDLVREVDGALVVQGSDMGAFAARCRAVCESDAAEQLAGRVSGVYRSRLTPEVALEGLDEVYHNLVP